MNRIKHLINHFDNTTNMNNTNVSHKPVKVCVTGAAGNIAYSVLFGIARGKLLGSNQPIELRLLDIPPMLNKVNGVLMELKDCIFL
jgi:hypothetical protein